MNMIKCITFDKEAHDNLPQHIKDKMKADRDNARKKAENKGLNIPSVSSSFDLEKANLAIKLIKNAECEDDVLTAVALKEELNWFAADEEIKDIWNDYYGDAKKYLP